MWKRIAVVSVTVLTLAVPAFALADTTEGPPAPESSPADLIVFGGPVTDQEAEANKVVYTQALGYGSYWHDTAVQERVDAAAARVSLLATIEHNAAVYAQALAGRDATIAGQQVTIDRQSARLAHRAEVIKRLRERIRQLTH